jgi:uncharacterized small protein (DUF1192 family)
MTLEQRVQHLELELRKARPSAGSDAPALMKRISTLESEIARLKNSTPTKPAVYTPAPAPVVAKPADMGLSIRLTALEREIERLKVKESAGAWLDWTPTLNTGDAVLSGYDLARYCKIGKLVFVLFSAGNKTISGSSGLINIGVPVASKYQNINLVARVYPVGGTFAMVQCRTLTASQVMTVAKSMLAGQWTGDETGVYVQVEGFYEAA